jgi:hypothetical protein
MGTVTLMVLLVATPFAAVGGVWFYCHADKLYGWVMWRLRRRVKVSWFANMAQCHVDCNYGPLMPDLPRAPRLETFLPELQEPDMPVEPKEPLRCEFDSRADFRQAMIEYRALMLVYKRDMKRYEVAWAEYHSAVLEAFPRVQARWETAWLAYETTLRQKCRSWENGGARTMGGDFQPITPAKRCFPSRSVMYLRKGDERIAELERQQRLTVITDLKVA